MIYFNQNFLRAQQRWGLLGSVPAGELWVGRVEEEGLHDAGNAAKSKIPAPVFHPTLGDVSSWLSGTGDKLGLSDSLSFLILDEASGGGAPGPGSFSGFILG